MNDQNRNAVSSEDRIASARRAGEAYSRALQDVYRTIAAIKKDKSIEPAARKRILQGLYARLSWKDIKISFNEDVIPYRVGVSFRSSISHTRLVKAELKKQGLSIARGGNPKLRDREFARALGVPTPRTIMDSVALSEIVVQPNTVIKPVSGSSARGVFLVSSDLKATSVYSGNVYETFEEGVRKEFGDKDRSWIVETMVGTYEQPAHDLKVFAFYGEPVLLEEIRRNVGEEAKNLFCFYLPDGEKTIVDRKREMFDGQGFPRQVLEYATLISKNTPAPFVRVDFLCAGNDVMLGEITPHPGGTYHGQLFERIDKMLGEKFLEAEGRLAADLLRGKDFNLYLETYSSEGQ